jgi:hypothetical protein
MPETKTDLGPLIARLAAAEFTGELRLRFERGTIAAAELRHNLTNSEFQSKPLPGIEREAE